LELQAEEDFVDNLYVAMVAGILILLASMISVEMALSAALVEITLGIVAGNFLGLHTTPWIDFLASFGSVVLTFLAGAEIDAKLLKEKFKESIAIGGISFLAPFLGAIAFAYFVLHWGGRASEIAGVALSTASLAVVYSVLVETGLTETTIGKIIMASAFVTNFGAAATLTLLFITPTIWLIPFIVVSAALIIIMPRMEDWFFNRYGNRVIEPEIKSVFAALFVMMFFAERAQSHAVLPAFILGLAVSDVLARHRLQQQRLRVVAFALLAPFFFLKSGMNISLPAVVQNLSWLVILLGVKLVVKFIGVYPPSRHWVGKGALYTTFLMSTGMTFGTISSLYGFNTGIISQAQFSVLATTVALSAVISAIIAQRFFEPERSALPTIANGRSPKLVAGDDGIRRTQRLVNTFTRDIMNPDVIAIEPDATLRQAAELMLNYGINGLPVVDADGRLVGIVGIKDVLRAPWPSLARGQISHVEPLEQKAQVLDRVHVSRVMARNVRITTEDRPVMEVAAMMSNLGLHPIPVIRDGHLVGIVSRADVVEALLAVPAETGDLPTLVSGPGFGEPIDEPEPGTA